MAADKLRVFAFTYSLKNAEGELLEASEDGEPIHFLEGSGQIIPGLEKQIVMLKAGDKKNVRVAAADGYGERDENLVAKVPRAQIPSREVAVGDMFRGGSDDESPVLTVTSVTDEQVTVDANHPLAGQELFFDIEIKEVRPASSEEMEHGHAHGPGGHHHH